MAHCLTRGILSKRFIKQNPIIESWRSNAINKQWNIIPFVNSNVYCKKRLNETLGLSSLCLSL